MRELTWRGYPDGIEGDEINLIAKIIKNCRCL